VSLRVREFRNEIRWTIVVAVLAVLAIVALWPRGSQQDIAEQDALPPAAVEAVRSQSGLQPCPTPGDPRRVPDLVGVSATCQADGSPMDVAAAVSGRPTLINVWATWCPPCRTELPALQGYSEQPGAVQVLGVQVSSNETDGLELLRQLGVRFPTVHDSDDRVRAALKAPIGLPASFVVTAAGEVRRVDPPVAFKSPEEVRTAVRRTLGAAP
jgi:thiol-disulfide isomerase/thioredoxin